MSINLQFNLKPGDRFRYQATFTTQSGGKKTVNSNQSTVQVVAVSASAIQLVDPNDPEAMISVIDPLGRPVDFLQGGVSIKDDLPDDMWDISNTLIFPGHPVNPGERWSVADGHVHITYQLIGTSLFKGREAAEVHATTDGYYGPIKYWVELATGQRLRQEYIVGGSQGGTATVIERI
jgi:hypothetical protein